MNVNPYLNFNGTCREAMTFYAEVTKGSIKAMMTNAEAPVPNEACVNQPDRIIHACVDIGGTLLMASDTPDQYYQKPQGTSVALQVDTPEEAARVFTALSEGGETHMPMGPTFFARAFGVCVDRFGTPWLVNCA